MILLKFSISVFTQWSLFWHWTINYELWSQAWWGCMIYDWYSVVMCGCSNLTDLDMAAMYYGSWSSGYNYFILGTCQVTTKLIIWNPIKLCKVSFLYLIPHFLPYIEWDRVGLHARCLVLPSNVCLLKLASHGHDSHVLGLLLMIL